MSLPAGLQESQNYFSRLGWLAWRSLAQLVRARLRSEDPSLLVDGRPFVDLGAALLETARRWGTT